MTQLRSFLASFCAHTNVNKNKLTNQAATTALSGTARIFESQREFIFRHKSSSVSCLSPHHISSGTVLLILPPSPRKNPYLSCPLTSSLPVLSFHLSSCSASLVLLCVTSSAHSCTHWATVSAQGVKVRLRPELNNIHEETDEVLFIHCPLLGPAKPRWLTEGLKQNKSRTSFHG